MKKIDYRHFICIAITLGFVACSVFVFPSAFIRIIESGRDFGLSVAYYFCELFFIRHNIVPTVNDFSTAPAGEIFLPETWQGFTESWVEYWQLWATKENLNAYILWLNNLLYKISLVLLLVLPLIVIAVILFGRYIKNQNNDYDKDSRPLKIFKQISLYTYRPAKAWLSGFAAFVAKRKYYWVTWLCIWAYNFNVFTIFLEFLAFYFYFVVSFDFINIYRQIYKLIADLYAPVTFIPLWAWIVIAVAVIGIFRRKIGFARLQHHEMKNRGFINARPIVSMTCGTMGKKKTTMITDMALSVHVMFKDKAFELLLDEDLKFAYFPWINLENEIKRCMRYHTVYNLATIEVFISKKRERWQKHPCRENIFGYDYERYGLIYNDKSKVYDIWQCLETYAKLYFIYVIQSSLIISNYSVRSDMIISDEGNFPLWDNDFFKRDSRRLDSFSRHSHIIDFDSLRLGKKVIENNEYADSFEFGVVLITEVGKERKNTLELKEIKAAAKDGNQKNDGFNDWLKMIRHSATVANYPFVKVITDEQRPESWGADARDLCEIIHIRDGGEMRLAMPFFFIGELLYSFVFKHFVNLYYKYRYARGDNTLCMYILKSFAAKIHSYYSGIYNTFGYSVLSVEVESGTQDGDLTAHKYYLANKKIYSKRFSTDCFSDFFTQKALRSAVGVDDLPEYATEKATFAELDRQHSYFIRDLNRDFNKHLGDDNNG